MCTRPAAPHRPPPSTRASSPTSSSLSSPRTPERPAGLFDREVLATSTSSSPPSSTTVMVPLAAADAQQLGDGGAGGAGAGGERLPHPPLEDARADPLARRARRTRRRWCGWGRARWLRSAGREREVERLELPAPLHVDRALRVADRDVLEAPRAPRRPRARPRPSGGATREVLGASGGAPEPHAAALGAGDRRGMTPAGVSIVKVSRARPAGAGACTARPRAPRCPRARPPSRRG